MENDDQQIGKILSRREILGIFGAFGAIVLTNCRGGMEESRLSITSETLPPCVARPSLTLGPYFVDDKINRSDVRSDTKTGAVKEGVPVQIEFKVSQISAGVCKPLSDAVVDIWQCDASGVYSDVKDPGFNTQGQNFLRGYQATDADGKANFTTIYPGWYEGRTIHTHFKIRTKNQIGGTYDFTSQLFFDDALTDKIHAQPPYAAKGQRTLRNDSDDIYKQGGGNTLLALTDVGDGGYKTTFEIGLDLMQR